MKVIIFVIDNLYVEYREGGITCDRLCSMFYKYIKMYMILRQESFTDVDLEELEVIVTGFLVCVKFLVYSRFLEFDHRLLPRVCSNIF